MNDPVSHPPHYTGHPSGVECVQITEHAGFCTGNAIKYIWRVEWGGKHDDIEDLKKARWYIDREIARREANGRRLEQVEQGRDVDPTGVRAWAGPNDW